MKPHNYNFKPVRGIEMLAILCSYYIIMKYTPIIKKPSTNIKPINSILNLFEIISIIARKQEAKLKNIFCVLDVFVF